MSGGDERPSGESARREDDTVGGPLGAVARLVWDRGTLLVRDLPAGVDASALPGVLWDPRTRCYRAPAYRYCELAAKIGGDACFLVCEEARPFASPELRPYQEAALGAWEMSGRRGTLVLPTGAGKTRVAVAAIARTGLSALCIAPTRVLVRQWRQALAAGGAVDVGQLGDGVCDPRRLTVATAASARQHAARHGACFLACEPPRLHSRARPLGCDGRPVRDLTMRLRDPLPHSAPRDKLRMATHLVATLHGARTAKMQVSPRQMRESLFGLAAQHRRTETASREEVLSASAAALGLQPEVLLGSLFADLPAERHVVVPAALPSPGELALHVNLALVQGLLRRAIAVRIALWGNARDIVRHVHLQGLLCVARRVASDGIDGVVLELSGPFALFRKTTLYGRAQASIVPRLPWCERFSLEADVTVGGKQRRLRLSPADPVFPSAPPKRFDSRLEEAFARDLARRFPDWALVREPVALDAGERLFFPDFALYRRDRPEIRWLVEIAGFWTPEYLENKRDQLRRSGVAGLVLRVDAERNCSDLDLPPQIPIVRYRRRIDPADVLAAVERLPGGTTRSALSKEILDLRAYFIDWAGRRPGDDPVHERLRTLQVGQRVRMIAEGGVCFVTDEHGAHLAALSSAAWRAWAPRLSDIVEVVVQDKIERRRADSGHDWRHLLRVERWWVPIVEILCSQR